MRHMSDLHMLQMYQEHLDMLWVHFAVIVLGAWLIAAPWLLGGGNWIATTADMITGALPWKN